MSRLAPTHRFTVEKYYRMVEAGILLEDDRVELLDGVIVDMLPIGPFHAGVNARLHAVFAQAGGNHWMVRSQSPVHLDDGSEPQPDLALVKPRADFYTGQHPLPEDVFLLMEVSDSSLRVDREEKRLLYARAGITEFWIVNLVERKVEIYRDPLPSGDYGSVTRHAAGDTVRLAAFPDVVVAVDQLL